MHNVAGAEGVAPHPPAPLPACGERGGRVAVGEGFNGTIETALLTGLLQ